MPPPCLVKVYVQDLAKRKCVSLIDTYKDHLSKLANKPSQLKDFASQVNIISDMKDKERNLFREASSVDQMYALLASCDVQVPAEDVVFHEDLHDKQVQYKLEIESAQKAKEDKMTEMISMTEANISDGDFSNANLSMSCSSVKGPSGEVLVAPKFL